MPAPALGELGGGCRGGANTDGPIPCDEGLVCYQQVASNARCFEPTPVEGCPTTPDQLDCDAVCEADQVYCECNGSFCVDIETCLTSCEDGKRYWDPGEVARRGCLAQTAGECDAFDQCFNDATCRRDDV